MPILALLTILASPASAEKAMNAQAFEAYTSGKLSPSGV